MIGSTDRGQEQGAEEYKFRTPVGKNADAAKDIHTVEADTNSGMNCFQLPTDRDGNVSVSKI